jgi:putative Mg2+ transporter-C (MgtC) family protein
MHVVIEGNVAGSLDVAESWSHLLALAVAAALGGLVGLERELSNRWAGLRTHMLTSLGTALLVLTFTAFGSGSAEFTSRVIQGIAAGIGFIGAGTILKLQQQQQIRGLTTASSIWLSAAVGTACGLKLYVLACGATILSLVILVGLGWAEHWLPMHQRERFADDGKTDKRKFPHRGVPRQ